MPGLAQVLCQVTEHGVVQALDDYGHHQVQCQLQGVSTASWYPVTAAEIVALKMNII